jgi:hypothetical protein
MKLAKNVKNLRPAYAVKLGEGKFVGISWQCSFCGATANSTGKPQPSWGSRCSSSSGKHMWVQV